MPKSRAIDALSNLAPLLHVRPELQEICRFGGDWEARRNATQPGWAYFHIVVRGECLIDLPGEPTIHLEAGDVLLLPHGGTHLARGKIGVGQGGQPIATEYRNGFRTRTSVGVAITTKLICGRLHFEEDSKRFLIGALPEAIVVRTDSPLWR